jgi:hypothetical protein
MSKEKREGRTDVVAMNSPRYTWLLVEIREIAPWINSLIQSDIAAARKKAESCKQTKNPKKSCRASIANISVAFANSQ